MSDLNGEPPVCATCRAGAEFNWSKGCYHAHLTNPDLIADAIVYERQREWAGLLTIRRTALKAVIAEAIRQRDRALRSGIPQELPRQEATHE